MIVPWESYEEMSSNTSEARGGRGGKPCHVEASPAGMPAGKGGVGVGTLCSIHKSQKATKNGHGQTTFPSQVLIT